VFSPQQVRAEEPVNNFADALAHTYTFNPELSASREGLKATDEQVNQAFSQFRPSLSGNYSRGNQRLRRGNGDFAYNTTDVRALQFSQPVFNGFGSYYSYQQAKDNVAAGREQLRGSEQNILLAAATAYADVIRTRRVVELSNKNQEVLKKHLDATQERFDVGEVTRTDTAQAQSRLATALADQTQALADMAAAESNFERVVRKSASPVLSNQMPDVELPSNLDEAIAFALNNNPVLKQQQFQAEAADKNVDVQRSQLLPSVSLDGSATREEGNIFLGGAIRNDRIGVNVNIPLYESGSVYSQTRQAKRQREQSKLTALDTNNRVREAVVSAWERLAFTRSAIEATKEAVDAAKVALDGVQQEQLYGARTTLDVLDAERELFQAEVNLVSAERDEAVAEYTLAALLGQFTAEKLKLAVDLYRPDEYYENNSHKMLGF
jgi:outer membrane protein